MAGLRAAGFERNPVPAGRTDRGVHARMQVLSMRLVEDVPPEAVAARLSAVLPPTVGIALSRPVQPKFHASWAATHKEYRYRLAIAPAPGWDTCAWQTSVDEGLLERALERVPGTRDFTAFVDSSSPQKPRRVDEATLRRAGPVLELRFVGEGFGRYMVRYLAASCVAVARQELSIEAFERALQHGGAPLVHRAPAQGLVLWEVGYAADVDPFTAAERALAPGVPTTPPFVRP